MAAKRIPQLDALSAVTVNNNDSLVIFDQDNDTTKRILRSNLFANSDGASIVGFNPTGDVSSTTVQAAIAELDSEKLSLSRLAASDGASLVGYTQGGTGASTRTVQTKLREWVSATDYGADPTGVADSSTAIQTALNENSYVFVPPGTYKVDTMITIGTRKTLELGSNCDLVRFDDTNGEPVIWMNGQYSTLQGQGQTTSTITSKARSSEGIVRVGMSSMYDFGSNDVSYNTIRDFNITGASFYRTLGDALSLLIGNPGAPAGGQGTGALDIGLHFQAPEIFTTADPAIRRTVYFNHVSNLRITDVNTGIWLHGFADGMHINTIQGFRVGNPVLGGQLIRDSGALDNTVANVFYHASSDMPTVQMEQLDNRNLSGTYTQAGVTITVTMPRNQLVAGESISLSFTSGSASSGVYTIASIIDPNTFTVIAAAPLSTSGNVTVPGTNTSIPSGYQGFIHTCYANSYRGIVSEQGGTAVSIRATDGTVSACFVETRDNVTGGNVLDANFYERNWFFNGASGATSSTNRFAAYASAFPVSRRGMQDQNGGRLFDEHQWSIGNLVENKFYNIAEISFDNNHETALVEFAYTMKSSAGIPADCGGKVVYLVKKDSAGALSAVVLSANYRTGAGAAVDVVPLKPYIPSALSSGTTVYFGIRTYDNGTGTSAQDLRVNARVSSSEIVGSVNFLARTTATELIPIAPDTTANFVVQLDDQRGREMTDQRDIPFLAERYHSIRSMAENTTYKAVEVTFSANQQSATVEINFAAGSGSGVQANGGGTVVYTMVKDASGTITADARLSRYVPSTISPCAPQIDAPNNKVIIPFLTFNNGTATTVQRLHMKSTVNTSNNIATIVPTFYESGVVAAVPGTPLSNTL